jgi:hypothetical protein
VSDTRCTSVDNYYQCELYSGHPGKHLNREIEITQWDSPYFPTTSAPQAAKPELVEAARVALKKLSDCLEEHPCWAGGFGPDGVCANWCERCEPIHAAEVRLRRALAAQGGSK